MLDYRQMISACEKAYRAFLALYPKSFRDEYGSLMAQLFRDQCRDAVHKEGWLGIVKLWSRVLPDIAKSVIKETFSATERKKAMKKSNDATLVLLVGTLTIGVVSALMCDREPMLAAGLMFVSNAALVAKVFAELRRPREEWSKGVGSGIFLAVGYALFMPAWANHSPTNALQMPIAPIIGIALVLNLFLPLGKGIQLLMEKRKSRAL